MKGRKAMRPYDEFEVNTQSHRPWQPPLSGKQDECGCRSAARSVLRCGDYAGSLKKSMSFIARFKSPFSLSLPPAKALMALSLPVMMSM